MVTLPRSIVHELVGSCHSVDAKVGLYRQPSTKGTDGVPANKITEALSAMGIQRTSRGMLSNGGRLYIDHSGPEYATAETTTAEEATIRSYDGDEIILGVFENLRRQEVVAGYQVNRRIVDHNRSSRGIHLNTATKMRHRNPGDIVKNGMALLNVAKGAIFGSGGLLLDKKGRTSFHHSPRLSLTTALSANYSLYNQRPLVREPFKQDGDGKLSRVETVTSDALNFAWPLKASLVSTKALIGLLELGYGTKLPQLVNPVEAAHTVGQYGNEKLIQIRDGKGRELMTKPLDIIHFICESVLEVDEIEEYLDDESDQVIYEIIEASDKMSGDLFSVAGQVESVARFMAMTKKMDKDRLKLGSEKMCRFDYAWDWLGGGIAEGLRNKRLAGWQGFQPQSPRANRAARLTQPPQDTRAKVRAEAIKRSRGKNDSDWDRIDFGDNISYLHPLSN